MYEREPARTIVGRLREIANPLIQVVVGARQSGKSTAISQALEHVDVPAYSLSADDVFASNAEWLWAEWQQARNKQRISGGAHALRVSVCDLAAR